MVKGCDRSSIKCHNLKQKPSEVRLERPSRCRLEKADIRSVINFEKPILDSYSIFFSKPESITQSRSVSVTDDSAIFVAKIIRLSKPCFFTIFLCESRSSPPCNNSMRICGKQGFRTSLAFMISRRPGKKIKISFLAVIQAF